MEKKFDLVVRLSCNTREYRSPFPESKKRSVNKKTYLDERMQIRAYYRTCKFINNIMEYLS